MRIPFEEKVSTSVSNELKTDADKRMQVLDRPVWIFDLDNTLYPADSNLFPQIDILMGDYISNLLKVDRVEARRVQKDLFVRYGTTLRGLMHEYSIDPEDFSDFVHDVDISVIEENPALVQALNDIPAKKLIFTNASTKHAERILDHLGIAHFFSGIFDVAASDYEPKPNRVAYNAFLRHFNVQPMDAVMIDDMARNLVPASELGMKTVWVKTENKWAEIDFDDRHIHYQTADLAAWLKQFQKDKLA